MPTYVLGGVTEEPLGARVPASDHAVQGPCKNRVLRRLDNGRQLLDPLLRSLYRAHKKAITQMAAIAKPRFTRSISVGPGRNSKKKVRAVSTVQVRAATKMGRSPGNHILAPTTATKKIDVGSPTGVGHIDDDYQNRQGDHAPHDEFLVSWEGSHRLSSFAALRRRVRDIVLFRMPPEHERAA